MAGTPQEQCQDESRELLKLILGESHLSEDRSLNRTGADGIHPNFALLEIRGPCSSKGTHSCLRGIVYTEATDSFAPCYRRIQYDRTAILKHGSAFWTVKSNPFTLMPNTWSK